MDNSNAIIETARTNPKNFDASNNLNLAFSDSEIDIINVQRTKLTKYSIITYR